MFFLLDVKLLGGQDHSMQFALYLRYLAQVGIY